MDTYKIVNGGMVDEKAFHHECTVNEITKFIHLPARNTFEPLDKFKYNLNTSKRDLSLLEKLASLLTLEALSVDHVQVAQLFHHHFLLKTYFFPCRPLTISGPALIRRHRPGIFFRWPKVITSRYICDLNWSKIRSFSKPRNGQGTLPLAKMTVNISQGTVCERNVTVSYYVLEY